MKTESFVEFKGADCAQSSRQTNGSRYRQHLAALLANLTSACLGMAIGWSFPGLPILWAEGGLPIPVNTVLEQIWCVNDLVPLGAIFGALPVGILSDKLGRKTVLLALAVPLFLGWLLILCAKNLNDLWMVYWGRFLCGLSAGATTVLVPLYCEEIAEVSLRGALGTYMNFMKYIGVLWIYVLSDFVPYYWFTASGCILPVVFVLTFVWMPESPVYLALKGDMEKAKQSLIWLRNGNDDSIQSELDIIKTCVQDKPNNSFKEWVMSTCCFRKELKSTTNTAIFIILGLMLFQQLTGINAVIFYTVDIFRAVGIRFLSGELSTLILGISQALVVLCSSLIVDRVGRKPLLLFSTIVMAICLLCASLYSYLMNHQYNVHSWEWVPLVSLILYVVTFALGIGPLPWFMMAEILPVHAKGWGTSLGASFNWTVAWIITKEFLLMTEDTGIEGTFLVFFILCIIGTIFIIIWVPETKGKTKIEIQKLLDAQIQ